jgi:hypothetical protein
MVCSKIGLSRRASTPSDGIVWMLSENGEFIVVVVVVQKRKRPSLVFLLCAAKEGVDFF